MTANVYILGGAQTDFARKWSREGGDIGAVMGEAAGAALDNARTDAAAIDSAHVGNFVAELFTGQGHLAGVLVEEIPALAGRPVSRHESACASGSMAVLAGMAEIEAGRSERVLVVGVEYMRNVGGSQAAEYLKPAGWVGREAEGAQFMWPCMFDQVLAEYDRRYGVDYRHLGAIAAKNFGNARRNPNAQTREWSFTPEHFTENDELNPKVASRLRRQDCSQITDGAAAIVLASESAAREYAQKAGVSLESIPRIKGWGHRTSRISYAGKLEDSAGDTHVFPQVREAIRDAFTRAGITDVFALDGIETHDCFTISEYMAIDHFGVTAPGEAWKAIEDGTVAFGGKLPFNASGGLIGLGHPVGASGVRMLLDAGKQVTGNAGDYQIGGARNIGTLNIGGSTTTAASFVVGV